MARFFMALNRKLVEYTATNSCLLSFKKNSVMSIEVSDQRSKSQLVEPVKTAIPIGKVNVIDNRW